VHTVHAADVTIPRIVPQGAQTSYPARLTQEAHILIIERLPQEAHEERRNSEKETVGLPVFNLFFNPFVRSEYNKQISGKGSCVERHVKTCLAGTSFDMFWAYIVDLIKHVVINCGSGKYQ